MSETYTPGYSANAAAFMARRTAEIHAGFFLPWLKPGMTVLDCGCGPGTITLGLAERVAPAQVTGIDQSAGQIDVASAAARRAGANVIFRTANIYQLPVAAGAFDALFSHALLEHLADPLAAVCEMRRVRRTNLVSWPLRCVVGKAAPTDSLLRPGCRPRQVPPEHELEQYSLVFNQRGVPCLLIRLCR